MDVNKKIATLESLVDYLKTELTQLNELLTSCGFTEGLSTLKQAAQEFLNG
jgi:prefoldin subunit 5